MSRLTDEFFGPQTVKHLEHWNSHMVAFGTVNLSLLMNGQKPLWLPGCDLREAILQASDLRGAWLPGTRFDRATLGEAILNGENLAFCRFDDANLDSACLHSASDSTIASSNSATLRLPPTNEPKATSLTTNANAAAAHWEKSRLVSWGPQIHRFGAPVQIYPRPGRNNKPIHCDYGDRFDWEPLFVEERDRRRSRCFDRKRRFEFTSAISRFAQCV